MKPTLVAMNLAEKLSTAMLIEIRNAAKQFAEICMDADDNQGAREFWALLKGADRVLDLKIGEIQERGAAAFELFEHKEEYWEYLMDRAGDMSRRDIASLIISRMSLADIAEDYADLKQFKEEI